jgi:branched-chain amino acid transport system substrate-binding protein
MNNLIATVVASAIAATSGVVVAQPAQNCPNPIPIAVTVPLTTGIALLGVQGRNGLQDAIDEINAAGGVAGKKFTLASEDATASATTALNSLNRLLDAKPVVVFSSMISPHVFTQAEVIKKEGVPFLFTGTNTQLTRQGIPWFFRMHVHDGQLADLVPRYVVEQMKKTKPAILAVSDDYGLGAAKDMQKTFESLNVKLVALETYGANDKDMSAQLTSIRGKGADVILVWGRPGDVTIVMKQHKQLGITTPIVGNSSVVSTPALNNLTAEEADGATALGGMIPQVSQDPAAQAFVKRVTDKTRVPPDNFAVAYFDAMNMVKGAIERVGCDRKAIRDELAKVKGYKGLLFTYSADQYGDLAHTIGIYRNKGKQPELIGTLNERGF